MQFQMDSLRAEQHISAEVVILQSLVFVFVWFGINVIQCTVHCTSFKAAIHCLCIEVLWKKIQNSTHYWYLTLWNVLILTWHLSRSNLFYLNLQTVDWVLQWTGLWFPGCRTEFDRVPFIWKNTRFNLNLCLWLKKILGSVWHWTRN